MMRRFLITAATAVLVLVGGVPPAAHAADGIRTPGSLSYTVTLTSNASGSTWTGHESVTFTNLSADPLPEVYLRLWDNYHGRARPRRSPSPT
jgi:hypothetical protein